MSVSEIHGRLLEPIETKFGGKTFARFIAILTANYKVDYSDKNKVNYENAKLIYNTALEKRFGAEEFGVILKKFISDNPYPNFTVSNFFKYDRLNLYPESWKNAEYKKEPNNLNNMECFVVTQDGKEFKMYRYYSPDNPVINNPNVRILNKNWDIGGHYKHQYENYSNVVNECSNDMCKFEREELKKRILDLLDANKKYETLISRLNDVETILTS